eukprot:1725413-Pyramimonas_sp.AAC.1
MRRTSGGKCPADLALSSWICGQRFVCLLLTCPLPYIDSSRPWTPNFRSARFVAYYRGSPFLRFRFPQGGGQG